MVPGRKLVNRTAPALLALAVFVTAVLIAGFPNASVTSAPDLPKVGSKEKLLELLKESRSRMLYSDYLDAGAVPEAGSMQKSAEAPAPSGAAAASNDYSQTNTQVEGVDEADLVKTDGQYIYQINGKRLLIINAYPANQMGLVSQISLADPEFTPLELYVDEGKLVVIGRYYTGMPGNYRNQTSAMIYPPIYRTETTRAIIYDIQNPTQPFKLREVEVEGSYLSSRKVGDRKSVV